MLIGLYTITETPTRGWEAGVWFREKEGWQ